jgi:hypothetical protein
MVQLMEALMIQGLGLIPEFVGEYAECQLGLQLNFYKPYPEPTKHVAAPRHIDDTVMTILHQADMGGLQVEKDSQWISGKSHADVFLCQHWWLWSGKSCTPQTKVAFHLMAYVNLQVSPTNCIGVSLCMEQSVHFSLK